MTGAAYKPTGRRGRRRGFALLVVLFAVLLLAVALAGYTMKAAFAHELARSRARTWKLLFAARAAVEESKAALWRQVYGTPELQDDETTMGGTPGYAPGPLEPGGESEAVLRRAPEPSRLTVEGAEVEVWFEDEAGKLPVNVFAAGGERARSLALVVARLFDELDLRNSTGLATAVRDFIDPDSEGRRERGALNAPVYHLSELAAAKGFDAATLFTSADDDVPAPADCLSAWHTGPVNINSANALVLSALAPRLTRGEITEIMAAREEKPFASTADISAHVDVAADALAQLGELGGFTTDTFTLYVEARAGGYVRRVKAVIWLEPAGGHTLYYGEGWDY